jgi:hypothetical protein
MFQYILPKFIFWDEIKNSEFSTFDINIAIDGNLIVSDHRVDKVRRGSRIGQSGFH